MRFIIIIALALIVYTGSARAELSLAVVDVQALLTESKAAKSIQEQAQKHRDAFLEELSGKEKKLREQEKKLIEDGKTLEKEEFLKRKKDFETKFLETQNMAKKGKAEIDRAYSKAMAGLMDKVYESVQSVADEKGYSLVLSRQNVVIGAQSLDITQDSLKALNKAVSRINLEIKSK